MPEKARTCIKDAFLAIGALAFEIESLLYCKK
jgi:hypothetical protein